MSDTPIFGLGLWAGPQAQPWVQHDAGLRLIEGLIRGSVLDRDLTVPPGACADGAAYLVGASATGLWAGHDGELALAVGANATNGWIFAPVALSGAMLWVEDEAVLLQYASGSWASFAPAGGAYDFGFTFESTPGADAILGRVRLARDVVIPADMAGAFGGGDTNPAATFAIDVQDDGASIGTITISTLGLITWETAGNTAKAVAAGSEVTFHAPATPDASVAGWSFVLAADRG